MNKQARLDFLRAADLIARSCNNEAVIEYWLTNGIADGDADSDAELEYYTHDMTLSEVMDSFTELMTIAYADGGLYFDGVVGGEKMKVNKNPPREEVRLYCIANNLFTAGTNSQYEAMFGMLDRQMPLHDIATMIWICSFTDKHADEIELDLVHIAEAEEGVSDDAESKA